MYNPLYALFTNLSTNPGQDQIFLYPGNQRFAEHLWTAARGKYEEAIQAQPKLAEAHYNLALALYRKGPIAAVRQHFIEAANLAPGHPVIWNAPPFRKYGTVEPPAPEVGSDDDYGHQH